MSTERLKEQIDRLAEAVVLADADDLPAIGEIHTELELLASGLSDDGAELAPLVRSAVGLVEDLVLGDVDDPDSAYAAIGQAVTAVQAVVCQGRPVAEIVLPELLRLDSATLGTESSEPVAAETPAGVSAGAPASGDATPATGTALDGDPVLLADFVSESLEHLDTSDASLLVLEATPEDAEALNAVFRAFHTIKGVAGFLNLTDIRTLAHESENLLDRARKGELRLEGAAVDTTFEAVDCLKALVNAVREALETGILPPSPDALPILLERIRSVSPAASSAAPVATAGTSPAPSALPVAAPAAAAAAADHPVAADSDDEEGAGSGPGKAQRAAVTIRETVKVDADRLDRMVDMIGELVIAESMVVQSDAVAAVSDARLSRQLSQLDKITRELQEIGMSLRMVPIRATFQKMARLARDVARKAGKSVEFVMVGEETELDKSVVDRIGDPLVHMVRNAVDHGLEPDVTDRREAGKPDRGRVELRAFHKGGNVHIEIEDDGRGLDREAILDKARERGLVEAGETLSDREVFSLIFQPGFSTAKKVTDVSGRGVGMDVVRRNIEALRGQVEIQSERGRGSVFSIRLPLTLAIIDGMVVRVGDERYIIPTLSVAMSVRPEPSAVKKVLGQGEMLQMQGELIPVFRLYKLFESPGAKTSVTEALVVIVEDEGKRVGLLVDDLLGQQQTVIKSLGSSLRDLPGVAGGAIMGDGNVGLILDIGSLVRLASDGAVRGVEGLTIDRGAAKAAKGEAFDG